MFVISQGIPKLLLKILTSFRKAFVISQGIPKLLLKILTSFRKVFVISQGIPKLLLKILTSFRKVFLISQGIPKVRNILTYLTSVYLWSSKGFQNFIWRFKFIFGGACDLAYVITLCDFLIYLRELRIPNCLWLS